MAMTTQILFIPFKGGLDTYSNAHVVPPGIMTLALGTMLDRPGAAYPGPGYSVTQWAPTTNAWSNHGIGSLAHGPATNADQLVLWSTQATSNGPGISVPGSSTTAPTQQPLAPWRQATQRFSNDSQTVLGGTASQMASAPQCAISGGRAFYVWMTSTNALAMTYQDLSTRAWAGPYYLASTNAWSASPAAALSPAANYFTAVGDGVYFRLAYLVTGTRATTLLSYLASSPLAVVTSASVTHGLGFPSGLDSISTADENGATGYGAIVGAYDLGGVGTLYGIPFNSGASTFGASVTLTANAGASKAFTCNALRATGASTNFYFAMMNDGDNVTVVRTALDLTGAATATVTAFGTHANVRQMSVSNVKDGDTEQLVVAIEYYPGTTGILGKSFKWNYVYLGVVGLSAPTVLISSATIHAWGGAAILGKFYGWYNGAEFRPLIPLRTGWFHNDGTWGTYAAAGTTTPAYPNGYLYDHAGTLFAKFGDADIGTDSMWLKFGDASYVFAALQAPTNGYRYTLTSGQQTVTWGFPQAGHIDSFVTDVTRADLGSPIGTRAGLSTVTWLAPTASEPPCAMQQFGGTLVIPGTITAYFDGSNTFEAGFFTRCPTPILQSNGGGGALPNATTYYYQTVAVYQDASGHMHRSAPSLKVSVVTTAVNDKININIPVITQTLRGTTAAPIYFEVYRSTGNPSTSAGSIMTMYLCTLLFNINTPGTDFVASSGASCTDNTLDANLTPGPTIYVQSSLSTNNTNAAVGTYSPPPFDSIAVWNNQVWGMANRNGPELWCTWPQDTAVLSPEGPAWTQANRVALPAEIGQPKALVGMDDKLIVLGTRSDYGFVGTAPSRDSSLADNPTFSAPLALPSPGGIKVLNGATRLPDGILIQGTQGFLLLDRSMKYNDVGLAVNDFASQNLYLQGIQLPTQRAIALFCANDATKNLLYHYNSGQWVQAEQPPADLVNSAAASVVVGSTRAVAGQASQVYAIASTGPYYFTATPYSKYMKYRSGWLPVSDNTPYKGAVSLAGSGMLREVQLLGLLPSGYPGQQTITLTTEYDYAGNTMLPSETVSYALTSATAQAGLEYQWRFGFSQGNAKRVRLTVTIDGGVRVSAGSVNPTVLLTGLMLSYDVDAGLSRLGSANSAGT